MVFDSIDDCISEWPCSLAEPSEVYSLYLFEYVPEYLRSEVRVYSDMIHMQVSWSLPWHIGVFLCVSLELVCFPECLSALRIRIGLSVWRMALLSWLSLGCRGIAATLPPHVLTRSRKGGQRGGKEKEAGADLTAVGTL